ncbi:MAG: hypothetical protein IJL26_11080 [Clostridia bacterium]|nr:hypothetical protein [Clostridia bacterium]
MAKKYEFKTGMLPMYLALWSVIAAGSVGTFYMKFVHYDPVLYCIGASMTGLCFGMYTYFYRKAKGKSHPVRAALIAGGVFIAALFAVMVTVHSVILKNEYPLIVGGAMTALLSVVFLVFTVLIAVTLRKNALKILIPLLCAAFFTPHLLTCVSPMLPERFDHPFENKIEETKGLNSVSKETRLIINADDSHWWGFWNRLAEEGRFDDDSLNEYVLNYADSGVTDLLFNIFCQTSDVPTEVFTFRGDLYGQTEQHGNPVDYGNYYGLNAFYNERKIDIFAKWIEKCREVNIRPWLTLRMNDCHDPDETTSQLRGDIFYTAEENGWTVGEEYGYFRHCFNYAIPQIRELMLDYTREQLLHYDVYGLELDFMREICCFDYINADTNEIVGIMNDYIRDTSKIVAEAEKKWGHDILLSVRLMRDLDQCYEFGFDALAWCEENLVDSITVTPRFSSNDSAMPIADWKARCPGVEIWAGVETLVNTNAKGCCASAEVARGYGAQYLTAGADGLYLFNYMTSPPGIGAREKEVYDTCGSLDEILKHDRRHIVTYQDTAPKGWEPYAPLPLKVKSGGTAELAVETGYIPDGAKVSVFVGLDRELTDADGLTLTVNGKECAPPVRDEVYGRSESDGSDTPQGYCSRDCFICRFDLKDANGLPNLQTLTFSNSGKTVKITYAEIRVTV